MTRKRVKRCVELFLAALESFCPVLTRARRPGNPPVERVAAVAVETDANFR